MKTMLRVAMLLIGIVCFAASPALAKTPDDEIGPFFQETPPELLGGGGWGADCYRQTCSGCRPAARGGSECGPVNHAGSCACYTIGPYDNGMYNTQCWLETTRCAYTPF